MGNEEEEIEEEIPVGGAGQAPEEEEERAINLIVYDQNRGKFTDF